MKTSQVRKAKVIYRMLILEGSQPRSLRGRQRCGKALWAKMGGIRCAPKGSFWHRAATRGGLTRSETSCVDGLAFSWLILTWDEGPKVGNPSVIDSLGGQLSQRLLFGFLDHH